MLADYSYYTREYRGTQIETEAEFSALQIRAEAYINKITFGRADDSNGVKNAVCAVCEVYAKYAAREGISSEDNDGYRITYASSSRFADNQLYRAARLYLPDEMLYRGVQ